MSLSRPNIQTNSATVKSILLYFDSVELLEMVLCFFYFHEASDSPYLIKNSVTNFLVSGHAAESASQKAETTPFFWLDKSTPCLGWFLTYLITLRVASMWDLFGFCMNWLSV